MFGRQLFTDACLFCHNFFFNFLNLSFNSLSCCAILSLTVPWSVLVRGWFFLPFAEMPLTRWLSPVLGLARVVLVSPYNRCRNQPGRRWTGLWLSPCECLQGNGDRHILLGRGWPGLTLVVYCPFEEFGCIVMHGKSFRNFLFQLSLAQIPQYLPCWSSQAYSRIRGSGHAMPIIKFCNYVELSQVIFARRSIF